MGLKKYNIITVKKDFIELTQILPLHSTNKLEDRCSRKDIISEKLAERIFDNPSLLDLLKIKIGHWLKLHKGELTYSLAGYIYYFKDEFLRSEKYFLKAVNKNPENLDNWFDLAFSLYHQGLRKHNLAKQILFNFDFCVKFFNRKPISLKSIESKLRHL